MNDFFWLAITYTYIFCTLHISEKLQIFGDEIARKLPHIAISNIWFVMNHCFLHFESALFIPFSMIIVMFISEKKDIFKGLKRNNSDISYGTVCYFISMLLLAFIGKIMYNSLIPVGGFFLILGYGDAFAALIGKHYSRGQYRILGYTKSATGNIAMFISSSIILFLYTTIYDIEYSFIQIITISMVATIIEALSIKGTDNFTIPIITCLSYNIIF